ncbi:E3 ubiquitin-protein ligase MARCH5-like [Octopus vulgaris]|uniref:E3 ubiquitin-protein ligase MARCH5-like n=3 Tax=Octopus TaxID=6643 RepID=A0AA36BEM4_OCTVU|nr:E3 ubiquitin-protein ligase MARCHF5 [Octopus bimaculoides]XP_014778530.1 E3 ubiquitin-protein ligase MARCHF5 [Octopus bimaculoides]XP_014778531.1 E3 ubiquitin-protein ligase MARCHF5 [Octopus bimaculoides]XP_029644664.1 E3 ubiquitin-protein ligase MARCHF5 isoform X1 [Octopus sinensis]XP_029644665.1 E3 ubiquitin-protein ligase MARCHF5 isoform X1 [Octopus sinensis]XP_036364846.1 E3 ubiquitin-protein ligase MARCHF5 isoform X1 [Octopus sinensis]CAI9733030.1 E3 ubiquitin-protein ligase MARCH5-li|eukprot:XP_014778528.1 PREDICTED: E3 ubiquitin-protein ligase MARCH5-like [Octopus bimaculoides]
MTERSTSDPEDEGRTCYICYNTDIQGQNGWLKPCRCSGSTKWVHNTCLQRWIDGQQLEDLSTKVRCPQCNTEFTIVYPSPGRLVYIMDMTDKVIYKMCPFLAGGIFIGSVYWMAVTYGAVTVMQVLGHKEGLNVMERADPLFLLFGLPAIPLTLICGKLVRWEDYVLRLWRKHSSRLPLINYLFKDECYRDTSMVEGRTDQTNPMSATRVMCGALILPTIATSVGKIAFSSVQSNFQRTLLGGVAFIIIKGFLKIYLRQQLYIQQLSRIVKDFNEDDVSPSSSVSPSMATSMASTATSDHQ